MNNSKTTHLKKMIELIILNSKIEKLDLESQKKKKR